MENTVFYTLLSLFVFLLSAFKLFPRSSNGKGLPPSPPSLPLIGHLHLLKYPLHRTFHRLSETYGAVFSLKFGSRTAIVVSSPAAVKECFTQNDIVFANRPPTLAGKHIFYDNYTIFTASYGDHWRNIRRIGASEIFSAGRLDTFSCLRRDEVNRLLQKLSSLHEFSKVELRSLISNMTFNIVMRMVIGKRYHGDDVSDMEEARKFTELMKQITSAVGTASPLDYFPVLKWLDPTGYKKRLIKTGKRTDEFIKSIINEHRRRKEGVNNTMIDHLLSLQKSQPEFYTDKIIEALVKEMFVGGTETTSVALVWTMANLLNNPRVLKKARDELDSVVGEERLVDESDIPNLPYLRRVISETLRLNPSAPLLAPHFSSENCTLGDCEVPRGTIIFVNVWAMHRDPGLWEDSTCFKPERFENEKEEEVAMKLMPFGVGRRTCPGSGMAKRTVELALASLIQSFEWDRIDGEDIDMTEAKGLSMRKATPLEALCKARSIFNKVLLNA